MFTKSFHLSDGTVTTIDSPRRFVKTNFERIFYGIFSEAFEKSGHKIDTPSYSTFDITITIDMADEAHSVALTRNGFTDVYGFDWNAAVLVVKAVSLHEAKMADPVGYMNYMNSMRPAR